MITPNNITSVNREAWLRAAYTILHKELLPEAPAHCAIAWGIPPRSNSCYVGKCFGRESITGKIEGGRIIFISAALRNPSQILPTLLHEMIHAALPISTQHGAAFSQIAKRCGLQRPWRRTPPTDQLHKKFGTYLKKLPPWPGGHLAVSSTRRFPGRQLKAICNCYPARIIRLSMKVAAEGGIHCNVCFSPFELVPEDRAFALFRSERQKK